MSDRPEVAVVASHLRPGRVSHWRSGGYGVPDPYVDAVRRAGGRPAPILPGDDRTPAELLERFHALLLVGGGDVEPRRYGQEPHGALSGLEPDRDEAEIALLLEADRRGMPALSICRGMQVMNVAFGGTLVQHLPEEERFQQHGTTNVADEILHDVDVAPASRLAEAVGVPTLSCSSHHHQGVDRVGEGLLESARSADGLVEAIERRGDGWILGVQWHPEDTADEDPAQQRLFDAFVQRAQSL